MKNPPVFTETKLKEIFKYTDLDVNPAFDAFNSGCFYRLYAGAKGTSKSFSRCIETIYRFVNESNFCSCWCRNQYNHIKTTLRPMFEKAFNFLAQKHGLDFRPFIKIYESGIFWDYDDGGQGRAIYFQNWEKIQAFQGFSLIQPDFRFGELVIDEPIEDPLDTKMKSHQLETLYDTQEKKLPLLIQNTINRESSKDEYFNFHKNVTFCYNLFTTKHFIVQKYHNKYLTILENSSIYLPNLKKLIEQKYLQKIDKEAENCFGLCVTMYSKFFIPSSQIDIFQKKYFEQLKNQNKRLWIITVAGFAFEENKNDYNYFLKNLIVDDNKQLRPHLIIDEDIFREKLNNHEILYVFDGYDPGKSDKASWVRLAIDNKLQIYVINIVEDLRNSGKKKYRELTKNNLIENIQFSNDYWELSKKLEDHSTIIFSDNDIEIEWLNKQFESMKIDDFLAISAHRKDGKNSKFGIKNRQQWERSIFENKLIQFLPGTEKLALNLSKQCISEDNQGKRDEKINPQIYDLINAFEMAATQIYQIQLINLESVSFING